MTSSAPRRRQHALPDSVERVRAVFDDPEVAAVTGPVYYCGLPIRQVGYTWMT